MNMFTKSWNALKWIVGCLDYYIFGKDEKCKPSCCETPCAPEPAPAPVEKPKRRRRKKK